MKSETFKSISSIMAAVVTVIGAGLACRASYASNTASNADFAGLVAAIKAEETVITDYVTTYEHYRAFTTYTRYDELGNIVGDEPPSSELGRLQREVWGMAQGLQYTFFPPRYLNNDGVYDIQRELDERFAESAQSNDIFPQSHFDEADAARAKTSLLTGILIIMSVAFWFFTVAQAVENRLKYLFGIGGFAILLFGLIVWLVVEVAL
jgi:hypothetical protein